MATLDDIVSVQIALQTAGVVRGDFGTPMIVAPLMTFPERVRVYTSYNAASEDDLPPSLLTALSDCFGQIPRPRQVKVGRRSVLKAVVKPSSVINLGVYSLTVGNQTYSYTSDATATLSEIVTGLVAAITNDTDEIVTATAIGGLGTETHFELAWIGANIDSVDLTSNLEWGTITPLADAAAVANDLNAILDEDNRWYGLVMVERVKQTQLDAAAWTEANDKLFVTATNEADVLNPSVTTDLLSVLKNTRYYRTAALFHTNAATEYPDAAWAGRVFTIKPGGETWALKSLASVTPSPLTSTQKQTVVSKGGNTFEFYQEQIALTNPGKVAAGEWIDVIRFRDWLKDTIQVNMTQMMINRDKVPYTDAGIQLCVNNLRKSLQEGQNVGGIAPDELDASNNTVPGFVITYPRSVELAPSIKASRVLSLGFTARLAGAIHAVEITGALAYEL
jgi:hypothetical protein